MKSVLNLSASKVITSPTSYSFSTTTVDGALVNSTRSQISDGVWAWTITIADDSTNAKLTVNFTDPSFWNDVIVSEHPCQHPDWNTPSRISILLDLLHSEIRLSRAEDFKSRLSRCMRCIVREFEMLPSVLYLRDLTKDGESHIWGGGYADIWKGQAANGDPICLKVLRVFPTLESRKQLFKDFSQEALVWSQLDHPNILPFLGINVDLFPEQFCLASPWCNHGSVMNYLEMHPEADKIRIILDITEGLKYLHMQNPAFVHGDLKGANILVSELGRCLLADFGLSVTVLQTLSLTGDARGSTRWMDPEMFYPKFISPSISTDMYALGCTILEIVTGSPPFPEIRSEYAVISHVMAGSRPLRPADGFSDEMWEVVKECWVESNKRPSIRDFVLMYSQIFTEVEEEAKSTLSKDNGELEDVGMEQNEKADYFSSETEATGSAVHQLLAESIPVRDSPGISTSPSASIIVTLTGEQGDERPPQDDNMDQRAHIEAAYATGRHPDQVVFLIVGPSGQGKSKTINRLLGQNILGVGRSSTGSRTTDIQRVKTLVHNHDTKVAVTLAFDDTPGDANTVHNDRATNLALFRIYKERHFPETTSDSSSLDVRRHTYPNVILLVVSWDSFADNQPEPFRSAIGESMYKLSRSGLVDRDRTNVIVVVTKATTFWRRDFRVFPSTAEKNTQWNIEAGRREGIIADLQRQVFPRIAPWPTVFVENGMGINVHISYPVLPNGQLSHQNLFNAIAQIIQHPGPNGTGDLAGKHILHVLTGTEPLHLPSKPDIEIIVDKDPSKAEILINKDPSIYSPALLQVVNVKLSEKMIDNAVDCVADTVDFAMGRTFHPRGRAPSRRPELSEFTTFVTNVLARAEVTTLVLLSALVYIDRARPNLHITQDQDKWALERVFLGALIIAFKNFDGSTLKNVHWSLCTAVFGKRDIGRIEREFLDVLDWELKISEADILGYLLSAIST